MLHTFSVIPCGSNARRLRFVPTTCIPSFREALVIQERDYLNNFVNSFISVSI